jgi:hypothetical protein
LPLPLPFVTDFLVFVAATDHEPQAGLW